MEVPVQEFYAKAAVKGNSLPVQVWPLQACVCCLWKASKTDAYASLAFTGLRLSFMAGFEEQMSSSSPRRI